MRNTTKEFGRRQQGITLVELMVALAIGSFLMIGAIQIYSQSRQAFVVNESIARVQETAQFAMDTIEADLRMASNWGRNSRGLAVEGRSLVGDLNPAGLTVPIGADRVWLSIVSSMCWVIFRSNRVSTSSDTPSPTISPALLHPQPPSPCR